MQDICRVLRAHRRKPTQAQLDFARQLINELEYDPEWYDLEHMTRPQVARLIDEMIYEKGRKDK